MLIKNFPEDGCSLAENHMHLYLQCSVILKHLYFVQCINFAKKLIMKTKNSQWNPQLKTINLITVFVQFLIYWAINKIADEKPHLICEAIPNNTTSTMSVGLS